MSLEIQRLLKVADRHISFKAACKAVALMHTMSLRSFPPTINERVYSVSSMIGGLMPDSSHRTSIKPADRFAPAVGSVNLTSARARVAKMVTKRTKTLAHAEASTV